MKYWLDIVPTGVAMRFPNETALMAEFNRTEIECAVYVGDECIGEAYNVEGDDGTIYFERVVYSENAEYVSL